MNDYRSTRDHLRSMRGGFGWDRNPGLRLGPWGILAVMVVVLMVGAGATVCSGYTKEKTTSVVVTDKDRVCSGDSDGRTDCKYLLFTDGGTFRITDSLLVGRFTSSDFYGQIKRCHRYELTYYGFRFGLTSSYPNVKNARDLGRVEGCEE